MSATDPTPAEREGGRLRCTSCGEWGHLNAPCPLAAPDTGDVDALAEWFREHVTAHSFQHADDEDFARALLASDWFAEVRRATVEQALTDAAEAVGPALQNEVGGHTSTRSVRNWLRDRAREAGAR